MAVSAGPTACYQRLSPGQFASGRAGLEKRGVKCWRLHVFWTINGMGMSSTSGKDGVSRKQVLNVKKKKKRCSRRFNRASETCFPLGNTLGGYAVYRDF